MTRTYRFSMALFGALVAALAGIASALGVFARGDGAFVDVVSVRGIPYEMATTGVYAYNAKPLVAEGVGWDVFTLLVVVPVMLATMILVARGSFRGRLVATGLFGYFIYMYLEYAVTWAFGPLFPLFVAINALSVTGIVWFSTTLARSGIDGRFVDFPVRSLVVLNGSMAALLAVMWSGRIVAGLNGDLVTAGLFGETTLVVQALDLGLVVPLALIVAIFVARRSSAGFAFGAAWSVMATAMSAALLSMLTSSGLVTGEMPWPPMVIFGAYMVGYGLVASHIFRAMRSAVEEASGSAQEQSRGKQWSEHPTTA